MQNVFWSAFLVAWISSDYFESLLLPQLLRGEKDSKQSDEFQATFLDAIAGFEALFLVYSIIISDLRYKPLCL